MKLEYIIKNVKYNKAASHAKIRNKKKVCRTNLRKIILQNVNQIIKLNGRN